ncbi:MAG TPA: copper-binding protein [Gallionella sp.]|nr:copper-binding protein [Gallionella sp.]
MKSSNLLLIVAIATGSATAYAAQSSAEHAAHHHPALLAPDAPGKPEGLGILKEVDAAAGKVKIAHEPITALNWPGMTMWFALQAPLPPEIKVGDSVRFDLQQGTTKEWVIARIERKK